VRAAIPVDGGGIAISELVRPFKARVGARMQEFIAMVKEVGRQDGGSKRILRRE